MFGYRVDQAKSFFLDRPRVLAMADERTRFVMASWGGYARKVARNSIKKRKGISVAGSPPHSHVGTLKRFLYFAMERERRTVIVGPAKTNQIFFDKHRQPVSGTVPEILEEGGQITIMEIRRFGQWRRADLRSRRRIAEAAPEDKRFRTATIAPRPYMAPAKVEADKKLPQFYAEAERKRAGRSA